LDEPAGWWRLNPLGIRVRPVQMAAEELRELAGYLCEADTAAVPVEVAVEGPSVGGVASDEVPAAPFQEAEWRVMVRLLGPVDVMNRGGEVEVGDRATALELLAWLVTHRDSATRTGAMAALWSGRDVDPRTLTNAVSGARLLLRTLAGEPPGGGEWIPSRQERMVLHPAVVSDCDLLLDRVAFAKRVEADEAATVLAGALPLLRGVPLDGREWLWADEQFVASSLAVKAAGMAIDLATSRLRAGEVADALVATEAGLRIIPGHEELVRLSIQAWVDKGDRRTALRVYETYERAAAARDEQVAPAIAKLRNQLLRAAGSSR
jgi:DNA-binding SARP family transcriptional activator